MGVFGSAAAGPAGPAASAGGPAPTCPRFWNPGPALRSIPLSACPSRWRSRRSLGAWQNCRPCAGWSPPKLIDGLSLTVMGAAGGGYRQVTSIGGALGGRHPLSKGQAVEKGPRTTARMGGHPCTGAGPLKDDPAMQLLGQEPLRRGGATGGWQGFVRRARFEGVGRRKRPLAARCSRGVFPNGTLRGFSDA